MAGRARHREAWRDPHGQLGREWLELMSRAHEDDAFRLAFTRLVLDRYVELAETACSLAPRIDTHAVVVEAIRMVDESQPAVDQTSGSVARIVPRAEWLMDWVMEAIRYIAATPSGHEARLGRKGKSWQDHRDERLDLLGRLEGLGQGREATVLRLLGWDDTDAVVALAGHGDAAVGVSVEGYRALAGEGIARLAAAYDEPRLEDPEYRLGYLRWRLEALMAPLAWVTQPGSRVFDGHGKQSTAVKASDIVELPELSAVSPEAADPVGDDVPDDEPTVVDCPEPEPVLVPASAPTLWRWSDEDLVPIAGGQLESASRNDDRDKARSGPPLSAGGVCRGRVLVVAGVVATMAIGVGALVASRTDVAPDPGRSTTGQATTKHVTPAAKQPSKAKHAGPTSHAAGRGAGKATATRQTPPKATTSTPAASQRRGSRAAAYVPVRKAAPAPTRTAKQTAPVTNADIQAEFLP